MWDNEQDESGPVDFMNRAAFVIGSLLAAAVIYFGVAAVLSLGVPS